MIEGPSRGQAFRRLASEDGRQHPSPGGAPMTDYAEPAKSYMVLIEGGPPSNYSAWCPELPGCAATADTIEETELKMREAIALHLAGLAEDGDPLPEPSGPGVYVARSPAAA